MPSTILRLPARLRRTLLKVIVAACLFFLYDSYVLLNHHPARHELATSSISKHERVFIASIHWNNEKILRSHWNKAVIDLVTYLGPKNVFVAVLENGSWDNSKSALKELDEQLAMYEVHRSILLDNTTHKDEVSQLPLNNAKGWVWTPRGRKELRRIPYLASLRNKVMREMLVAHNKGLGPFDKVLWLTDVVFTTEDVVTLLATNEGHYAAACSLDFAKPPLYYDTFALRDTHGAKTVLQTWPYFSSGASRHAMLSGQPVPVKSCWNGIVAMNAQPFYGSKPLQFRGIDDALAAMHLEASECCLIHSDNPESETKGVWLNPNVRVAYTEEAYRQISGIISWPKASERLKGVWEARFRAIPAFWVRFAENWLVQRRLQRRQRQPAYERETDIRVGLHCIVNEMQILVENGWMHL